MIDGKKKRKEKRKWKIKDRWEIESKGDSGGELKRPNMKKICVEKDKNNQQKRDRIVQIMEGVLYETLWILMYKNRQQQNLLNKSFKNTE